MRHPRSLVSVGSHLRNSSVRFSPLWSYSLCEYILLGVAILGEKPRWTSVLGASLIAAGSAASKLLKKNESTKIERLVETSSVAKARDVNGVGAKDHSDSDDDENNALLGISYEGEDKTGEERIHLNEMRDKRIRNFGRNRNRGTLGTSTSSCGEKSRFVQAGRSIGDPEFSNEIADTGRAQSKRGDTGI